MMYRFLQGAYLSIVFLYYHLRSEKNELILYRLYSLAVVLLAASSYTTSPNASHGNESCQWRQNNYD